MIDAESTFDSSYGWVGKPEEIETFFANWGALGRC
jgi:hypothetical protein